MHKFPTVFGALKFPEIPAKSATWSPIPVTRKFSTVEKLVLVPQRLKFPKELEVLFLRSQNFLKELEVFFKKLDFPSLKFRWCCCHKLPSWRRGPVIKLLTRNSLENSQLFLSFSSKKESTSFRSSSPFSVTSFAFLWHNLIKTKEKEKIKGQSRRNYMLPLSVCVVSWVA